jgi:hypothetical protein
VVKALADLAEANGFASMILAENEPEPAGAGMDVFLRLLSDVIIAQHTAPLLLQASRAIVNLVCGSPNESFVADMVGGAVFASGIFPLLERLTVPPQDVEVVRNVALTLAQLGKIFTPMSMPMSMDPATRGHKAHGGGGGGGDSSGGVTGGGDSDALVGCGSAVGGSFAGSLSFSSMNSLNSWSKRTQLCRDLLSAVVKSVHLRIRTA